MRSFFLIAVAVATSLGCEKKTNLSHLDQLCGLLQADGSVSFLAQTVDKVEISFKDCSQCFAVRNFLKRCSDQGSGQLKYPPHPEIMTVLFALASGTKPERDIIDGLIYFCERLSDKLNEKNNTVQNKYILSLCDMAYGSVE